jgi:transcriptional regulator with XRE-family HTH domain
VTLWKTETELGREVFARGLGLQELAERLGCSANMTRYLIRQIKLPSAELLIRLQDALGRDDPAVPPLLLRHLRETWWRLNAPKAGGA